MYLRKAIRGNSLPDDSFHSQRHKIDKAGKRDCSYPPTWLHSPNIWLFPAFGRADPHPKLCFLFSISKCASSLLEVETAKELGIRNGSSRRPVIPLDIMDGSASIERVFKHSHQCGFQLEGWFHGLLIEIMFTSDLTYPNDIRYRQPRYGPFQNTAVEARY